MKFSTVYRPRPAVPGDAKTPRTPFDFGHRTPDFGREGVALVITLIMLSIITFMAVTFLVLSQRERSSVNGDTDQKIARNATDAALARVSTELLTHMLVHTNFQDFDLLVSTNYINNAGLYNGTPGNLNPTNVNYDHLVDGTPIVNSQDRNINIASLLFNPRPPVYVVTNKGTGAAEFRFYYDANRNGRFDRNGNWPIVAIDAANNPAYLSTNNTGQIITEPTNYTGWVISNSFVGDPEWIGVLERPEELHSADNRFIARYAYIVVPAGKTLDVNYIHNRAKRPASLLAEGFVRNQGVGTWEINFAGFLADLNTNAWWNLNNYVYNQGIIPYVASTGSAFTNANDLLTYRYGPSSYVALSPASALFTNNAAGFANDNIDRYSDGPLMLGTSTNEGIDPTGSPWSGADNTNNHYFSTQDIFSQMPPGFRTVLSNLGTSNDSYNAYTFYRMLAQLGSDTAPDQGKININYKNTDNSGNVIPGMETNLIAWTPLDFFTNAANAMFKQMNMTNFFDGNLITVTNIPIYENPVIYGTNINYYTPAVHRILQLAANMYDATTTRYLPSGSGGPTNYPSVFRPIFRSQNGVASIVGYQEVTDPTPAFFPFLDAQSFVKTPQPLNTNINMYGAPWVIGAKKGFPNFNEFSLENPLQISRKLQFTNATGNARSGWTTNQLFDFAITNSFGIEAWNSYTNAYGRPLRLVVSNEMTITITNQTGPSLLTVSNLPYGNDISFTGWPGWQQGQNGSLSDTSFIVPLAATQTFTNGIYERNAPFVVPLNPPVWGATFAPHLWLSLAIKLRYILIDTSVNPNRILDFVNIASTQPTVDIIDRLNNYMDIRAPQNSLDGAWSSNFVFGSSVGILSQIQISEIDGGSGLFSDTGGQARIFRTRLLNGGTNNFQAPYSAPRTIYQRISWQANDPLVHYTAADITSTNGTQQTHNGVDLTGDSKPLGNLTNLNYAYQPWGGYHVPNGTPVNQNKQFDMNWQVKDPMLQQSDNWDFPTNKLANIGWLGRIHRGTPWQTIYMKPSSTAVTDWRNWSNDNLFLTNLNNGAVVVDGVNTHPTADYGLFDLFTTEINDNASRGRLNVNQTNLAAWSAVLSSVNVISNSFPAVPLVISPAGVYDPSNNPTPVAAIVQGINATRANTNTANGAVLIFPNGVFHHAGDVLATPQLTVASPFLNTNNNALATLGAGGINDEMLERIPQQVMSLLTLNQNPRFVIYSYGQTLHPADHSLVTGGTFNGLCTNYQITAESATRAVVRVEGTPDPQYIGGRVDSLGRSYPPHLVVEQFNVLGPD